MVFPFVPVIPATRSSAGRVAVEPHRGRRHCRPRVGDQRFRDAQAQPPLDDQRRRSRLDGCGAKSCPSAVAPGTQKKSVPARALRLSISEIGDLDGVVALDLGMRAFQHLAELHRGRF